MECQRKNRKSIMKTPIGQFPEPKLIDSNYLETLNRVRNNYQTATDHYPGNNDPESFQLDQLAYEREMLVDDINFMGKQNLLAFADDKWLDNAGALVDCERLKPTASHCPFEGIFTPNHGGFELPKGFSVLAKDGKTVFATQEALTIPRGEVSRLLTLYCTQTGPQANGFRAGDINQISAPLPQVKSLINTTISVGGSKEESNDNYRERIYLAPSGFSSAGPFEAYEYFARSAHPSISRVKVLSPEPNHIDIYVLLYDEQTPSQAILDIVEAYCNAQKRRPIGDLVKAKAAEPNHVGTTMHLQIYTDMQSMATSTVTTVRNKLDVLTDYSLEKSIRS
jgi:phage-related baseplate assembly protein